MKTGIFVKLLDKYNILPETEIEADTGWECRAAEFTELFSAYCYTGRQVFTSSLSALYICSTLITVVASLLAWLVLIIGAITNKPVTITTLRLSARVFIIRFLAGLFWRKLLHLLKNCLKF